METIREYLNNMFAGLPDTPEVHRAYDELAAMMEDKYTELIEEGCSENEAVGTVISEFGNLEELKLSLGIDDSVSEAGREPQLQNAGKNTEPQLQNASNNSEFQMQSTGKNIELQLQSDSKTNVELGRQTTGSSAKQQMQTTGSTGAGDREQSTSFYRASQDTESEDSSILTDDMVCDYIAAGYMAAMICALGVFLCVASPSCPVFFGELGGSWLGDLFSSFGTSMFFVFIAAAVAGFMISASYMKPWKAIRTESFWLDDGAEMIVKAQEEITENEGTKQRITGIVLCILSVVPVILFRGNFGASLFFLFVAAGVALIVYSSRRKSVVRVLRKAQARAQAAASRRDTVRRYRSTQRSDSGKSSGSGRRSGRRSGNDKTEKFYYSNPNLQSVMSVYWQVVICVYIAFSFLSGLWGCTWLLLIFAAAAKKLIEARFGEPVAG